MADASGPVQIATVIITGITAISVAVIGFLSGRRAKAARRDRAELKQAVAPTNGDETLALEIRARFDALEQQNKGIIARLESGDARFARQDALIEDLNENVKEAVAQFGEVRGEVRATREAQEVTNHLVVKHNKEWDHLLPWARWAERRDRRKRKRG